MMKKGIRYFSNNSSSLTLWHSPNARSLRCVWTLEEIGNLNYNLITLPFPPRIKYREYLQKNILGTIPYLEDGEVKMTESSAISHYLASKYGSSNLIISPNENDYGIFLNWMHHADATLTFPQAIVLRYTVQEKGRADEAARDYAKWYIARLRLLDNTLKDKREFLVGNRFTVADICITYALFLGKAINVDGITLASQYQPQTTEYMERMINRPAFQASLLKQKESLKKFKEEHPEAFTPSKA